MSKLDKNTIAGIASGVTSVVVPMLVKGAFDSKMDSMFNALRAEVYPKKRFGIFKVKVKK